MPHKGSRVLEGSQAQDLEIKGLGVGLGFGTNRRAESEQVTSPRNSSRPNSEAALRPWSSARLLKRRAAPERPSGPQAARPLRNRSSAPREAPLGPLPQAPQSSPSAVSGPTGLPPARRSDGACSQWAAGRPGPRRRRRPGQWGARLWQGAGADGPPRRAQTVPFSAPSPAKTRAVNPERRKGRSPPLRRSPSLPDELVQGDVRHLAPPREPRAVYRPPALEPAPSAATEQLAASGVRLRKSRDRSNRARTGRGGALPREPLRRPLLICIRRVVAVRFPLSQDEQMK